MIADWNSYQQQTLARRAIRTTSTKIRRKIRVLTYLNPFFSDPSNFTDTKRAGFHNYYEEGLQKGYFVQQQNANRNKAGAGEHKTKKQSSVRASAAKMSSSADDYYSDDSVVIADDAYYSDDSYYPYYSNDDGDDAYNSYSGDDIASDDYYSSADDDGANDEDDYMSAYYYGYGSNYYGTSATDDSSSQSYYSHDASSSSFSSLSSASSTASLSSSSAFSSSSSATSSTTGSERDLDDSSRGLPFYRPFSKERQDHNDGRLVDNTLRTSGGEINVATQVARGDFETDDEPVSMNIKTVVAAFWLMFAELVSRPSLVITAEPIEDRARDLPKRGRSRSSTKRMKPKALQGRSSSIPTPSSVGDLQPYLQQSLSITFATLDLNNPDAVLWMQNIIIRETLERAQSSGWMCDFGEYLPFDAVLYPYNDAVDAGEMHNKYPEQWAALTRGAIERYQTQRRMRKMTKKMQGLDLGMGEIQRRVMSRQLNEVEEEEDEEIMFFMRSAWTQSPQHVPVFWLGDQLQSWDDFDGLGSVFLGALSSGLSGHAVSHSDIGGYNAEIGLGVSAVDDDGGDDKGSRIQRSHNGAMRRSRQARSLRSQGVSSSAGQSAGSNGDMDYIRSPELLARWTEVGVFSHAILRTHIGSSLDSRITQIYSNDDTIAHFARFSQIFAALAAYRQEVLLPQAHERGWPMTRPFFLHYERLHSNDNMVDQNVQQIVYDRFLSNYSWSFLFGRDFHVTPVLQPGQTVADKVFFPRPTAAAAVESVSSAEFEETWIHLVSLSRGSVSCICGDSFREDVF